MGIYIYKLSRKPEINTPLGGVHVYHFYEKAAAFWNNEAQGNRIARFHQTFPKDMGPVMVVSEKREGAVVYLQETPHPVFYDGRECEGTVVGRLFKQAGRWSIKEETV